MGSSFGAGGVSLCFFAGVDAAEDDDEDEDDDGEEDDDDDDDVVVVVEVFAEAVGCFGCADAGITLGWTGIARSVGTGGGRAAATVRGGFGDAPTAGGAV